MQTLAFGSSDDWWLTGTSAAQRLGRLGQAAHRPRAPKPDPLPPPDLAFRDLLADARWVARTPTIAAFRAWMATSRPGDVAVYHVGRLSIDRSARTVASIRRPRVGTLPATPTAGEVRAAAAVDRLASYVLGNGTGETWVTSSCFHRRAIVRGRGRVVLTQVRLPDGRTAFLATRRDREVSRAAPERHRLAHAPIRDQGAALDRAERWQDQGRFLALGDGLHDLIRRDGLLAVVEVSGGRARHILWLRDPFTS